MIAEFMEGYFALVHWVGDLIQIYRTHIHREYGADMQGIYHAIKSNSIRVHLTCTSESISTFRNVLVIPDITSCQSTHVASKFFAYHFAFIVDLLIVVNLVTFSDIPNGPADIYLNIT